MTGHPSPNRILLVKLSSLGDIVHTIPLAAVLRRVFPAARVDWLIEQRFAEIPALFNSATNYRLIDLSTVSGISKVPSVIQKLRRVHYDLAIDVQGLTKSAFLARMSGAPRVIGFSTEHLREKAAGIFYTEQRDPGRHTHVMDRNLNICPGTGNAGGRSTGYFFGQASITSAPDIRETLGIGMDEKFVVLSPGTTWSSKKWPAERFGNLARMISSSIRSVVQCGPGEDELVAQTVHASAGAAVGTPPIGMKDLAALLSEATLVVSPDSGPMHLAAAFGTPVVAIHGPTDPARNGPWDPSDGIVSRYAQCECRYERKCRLKDWCTGKIQVGEVGNAVMNRLSRLQSS